MAEREPLTFDFPLPRTHCGVALGNGLCGALVWGRETINVTVNRADWWDHRGGERLAEGNDYRRLVAAYDPDDGAPLQAAFRRDPRPAGSWRSSRLPVGRCELVLKGELRPAGAVLEPWTGHLWITLSGGGRLRLAMHPVECLVVIDDPHGAVERIVPRPAWEWVAEQFAPYGFTPPERLEDDGLTGWVQATPADSHLAALAGRCAGGHALALALGAGSDQAAGGAGELLRSCRAGVDEVLAASAKWWGAYWDRCPQLDLPDEFFDRFHRYALYKLGAATSPHSPLPAGLQGPWVEEYQPTPWSGDYHFNVNIQQIYTLAFSAGQFEHLLPLFDLLDSFADEMRHNARVLHGIDDGYVLAHAVDDRGRACGGISSGSILDQAVIGWAAHLYWLYYEYTGDRRFLAERAWPMMRGVMRAYEAMLEEYDGRLSMPVSISAEYAHPLPGGRRQNAGRDPSYQLACVHKLARSLLTAARILGREPDPSWTAIVDRLPRYTVVRADDGEERIAIWEGQDLDICHRHHSHLGGVYPFDSLGELSDDDRRLLDNSLDHWIWRGMGQWSEWCMPWAAILQARCGLTESPLVILKLWREVFCNEGLTVVYLPRFRGLTAHRRADLVKPRETNEIMQLDGCMAGATALHEMLLHTHGGVTRTFPAVSSTWPEVSFSKLRAPGGLAVSGRLDRDGWRVQVTASRDVCLALTDTQPPSWRITDQGPGVTRLAAGETLSWDG